MGWKGTVRRRKSLGVWGTCKRKLRESEGGGPKRGYRMEEKVIAEMDGEKREDWRAAGGRRGQGVNRSEKLRSWQAQLLRSF